MARSPENSNRPDGSRHDYGKQLPVPRRVPNGLPDQRAQDIRRSMNRNPNTGKQTR